jgi:hypothetical protein
MYKVVQIWSGLIVCKQVTVCPGHIWTTLYIHVGLKHLNCKTKNKLEVSVKQSYPYTGLGEPRGLWEFEALTIFRQSAHKGGEVESPKHFPPLPPREVTWHSFLLKTESTPGPYCGRKDEVNKTFQRLHLQSNPRPFSLYSSASMKSATTYPRTSPLFLNSNMFLSCKHLRVA